MFSLYLTQSGGFLGTIAIPFGWILNGIYEFFNLFGVENVALCIIVFTFITRALMIPLTIKQQKFSKMSSIMQPELNQITAKYKGKKDEASVRKMQIEQQAVYEKYGANPTAGCLPLLISLPIMLALYKVIQNVPAYVPNIKQVYENIANALQANGGYGDTISEMATTAGIKMSTFSEYTTENPLLTTNHLIDIFSKFTTAQWTELATAFPSIADVINENSAVIMHINSVGLGGLNIANAPGWSFPGIIIPILAVVTQWLQSKLMQVNTQVDKDNPTAAAMNSSMTTVMPLMSGFFCVMFPIGIGIYWVASAVFGIVQQFFVNKYMNGVDVNELVSKSKEKADKKRAKKTGVSGEALKQISKTQTKSINNANAVTTPEEPSHKSMKDLAKMSSSKDLNTTSGEKSEVSYKAGSIAANANLLKNRYNDKGEK